MHHTDQLYCTEKLKQIKGVNQFNVLECWVIWCRGFWTEKIVLIARVEYWEKERERQMNQSARLKLFNSKLIQRDMECEHKERETKTNNNSSGGEQQKKDIYSCGSIIINIYWCTICCKSAHSPTTFRAFHIALQIQWDLRLEPQFCFNPQICPFLRTVESPI